jgi:UDP-N-acetyl-D-mannosaminuronic acid dehydrogenase
MDKNICIIGLGYVGLTLAVAMAEKKFQIIGIEKNKNILNKLDKNQSHFFEPQIDNKIKKIKKMKLFKYFETIPKNINCSTYIITVGTPLNAYGKSRVDLIKNVTKKIAKVLKDNDLVILRSTVKIGTTKNIVFKMLNKSKKKFNLCYCPERTQEGKALEEIKKLPQIISGYNKNSILRAKNIFKKITRNYIVLKNLETAEMLKLVDNTYRDVNFAFSNEIARLCSKINIDAIEVIEAGKFKYPRTNLALPGPVGGPCLTKDTYILNESFKNQNFHPKISLTARHENETVPNFIIKFLKKKIDYKKINKIVLLGLAFKGNPPTSDLRGSVAIDFIKELKKNFRNSKIFGYDNFLSNKDFSNLKLSRLNNLNECFKNTNILLILNNNVKFAKLNLIKKSKHMAQEKIIYDCWNLHSKKIFDKKKLAYNTLGNHN